MLEKITPPYVAILLSIAIINIFFSSYFITFLLIGVVSKIFYISLREEYIYTLLVSIMIFLIIENTQGLKLFFFNNYLFRCVLLDYSSLKTYFFIIIYDRFSCYFLFLYFIVFNYSNISLF